MTESKNPLFVLKHLASYTFANCGKTCQKSLSLAAASEAILKWGGHSNRGVTKPELGEFTMDVAHKNLEKVSPWRENVLLGESGARACPPEIF